LIELAVAIGLTSCLLVALGPQARGLRRAHPNLVGATAHRAVLGPRTLRAARLIPILGGPARMPQLLPAMAWSGAGQLDANVIDFPAPASAQAVAAGSARRRSTRPAVAASTRRAAELTSVGAPGARTPARTSASRRSNRKSESVSH
jgi:hypothetical protein